jgi:hypothetical protein
MASAAAPPFWFRRPSVLLSIQNLVPRKGMSLNARLNMAVQWSIVLGVALTVATKRMAMLAIPALVAAATLVYSRAVEGDPIVDSMGGPHAGSPITTATLHAARAAAASAGSASQGVPGLPAGSIDGAAPQEMIEAAKLEQLDPFVYAEEDGLPVPLPPFVANENEALMYADIHKKIAYNHANDARPVLGEDQSNIWEKFHSSSFFKGVVW